jgi:hypothetical protein
MTLAEKIISLLEPGVGDFMANSILNNLCKKLGVLPGNLGAAHLAELSLGIQHGISIFVGTDQAESISKQIAGLTP